MMNSILVVDFPLLFSLCFAFTSNLSERIHTKPKISEPSLGIVNIYKKQAPVQLIYCIWNFNTFPFR